MSTSDSRVTRSRWGAWRLALVIVASALPASVTAQRPAGADQDPGGGAAAHATYPPSPECRATPGDPSCAPDQRLRLDESQPRRRFATYSDLIAWARARVSVGLVLAPFPPGPLARVRFELEALTRLRSPRGVELVGRVALLLLGQGLDGLFVSVGAGYVAWVQQGGRVLLGAELGYARHFASLYISASAGANVEAWSRDGRHRVAPIARLALGHAFY